MEDTIKLKDVLAVYKRRIMLILMVPILAAIIGGFVTHYFITPIYEAKTLLLVNQTTGEGEPLDVNLVRTNIELTNTYSTIIKSPNILNSVVEELSLNESAAELDEKVTVNNQTDSQIMEIVVEDSDQEKAVQIANSIATTFQQEIVNIMAVDNVNILSQAVENPNPSPIRPDLIFNILLAFVLGLFCAIGLSLLLEYLDTSIHNEKDIETALGIPVIGNISLIKQNHKPTNKMVQNPVNVGGQSLES